MNIRDFSPKKREDMVKRILESKQERYEKKNDVENKVAELRELLNSRNLPESISTEVHDTISKLESLLVSGNVQEGYMRTCPNCGANLDPGERCDCQPPIKVNTGPQDDKKKNEVKRIIKESRLPKDDRDPQYGIPEQKKYPLFDKEHVISAIKLFGHVEPRFEEKLARAIIAKMKKFDIPFNMVGSDNRLSKYIPNYEPRLNESVLDPVHKTRPIEIFRDEKMIPEVRNFILNLLDEFKKNTGLDFNFKKIYMIGSSTGFQYSDISDIDIDVEVDKPKEKFDGKWTFLPKGVILPNTQRPINVFLMFSEEETNRTVNYAESCYDLLKDEFIKVSQIKKQEIPLHYVAGLSKFFMNGLDVLFGEFERNKQDLEKLIKLNPNEVQISEKERDDAISKKIIDIQTNADSLKLAHHFLFTFNNEGYNDNPFRVRIDYRFEDAHYSMNSLVYKYVDSFGYMERMFNMEKEANTLIKMAKSEIGKNFNNPTNEVEQKLEVEKEIKVEE